MDKEYVAPYINFQGHAREAMEFYHGVFGGKLDLYASNDQGQPKPAGPGDRIMHSRLEADRVVIIGSDGHPDYPAKVGEHMAIVVGGTDKDRLTRVFYQLADGGQIKMPLTAQPWGGTAGWLSDRFGINWNFDI